MMDGWHKTYNLHGLNALIKEFDMPVAALGVGEDEKHRSVDGAVKYPTPAQNKIIQPDLAMGGYEYTQLDGEAVPLTGYDFPSTYYVGETISNFGLIGSVK